MSNEEISLALKEREVVGKKVKQLRREGVVPAVIHDHGKDSKIVMAPSLELTKVFQNAGKHHPVNLSVGNQKYLAIIKDADFDPKKHQLRHVVFNAIKADEAVETEVPVVLDGEIPAEKLSLMVITDLDTVEVEALPKNLPDELKVSASALEEVGDKVYAGDIRLPEGVTLLTETEAVIAHVEMPKDQVAEANAAAEEQAAADAEAAEGEEGESAEGGEAAEASAKDGGEEEQNG